METAMSDKVVGASVARSMKGTSARIRDKEIKKPYPSKQIKFDPNKEAPSKRLVDDDFSQFSGRPCCIVLLATSHLAPKYHMGTSSSIRDKEIKEPYSSNQIKFDPNNEAPSKRLVDDDFSPFSGKPSCIVLLSPSHLAPKYHMGFPMKMWPELPSTTIPALISCRGKIWKAVFTATNRLKRLEPSWKALAIENNLEVGDVLAWEAMEISKDVIKFKLQIIKGKFPLDLPHPLDNSDNGTSYYGNRGVTIDDAIILD